MKSKTRFMLVSISFILLYLAGSVEALTVKTFGYNDPYQAVINKPDFSDIMEAESLVALRQYTGYVIVAPSPYQYMVWLFGPNARIYGTFTKETNVIAIQFASSDSNDGIAKIYLDGVLAATFDTMSQGSWYAELSDIPLSIHTVAIEALSNSSGQDDLHIDAIAGKTQCIQPPADIIGWWPGDGYAYDIMHGHSGTPVGGVTYSAGKVDQGFAFDGAGRIEIPDTDALNLTGPMTVDAWISFSGIHNQTPGISNSPIAAKWGDTLYGTAGYGLFIDADGRPSFNLSATGSDGTSAKASTPVAPGTFTHVAGVWTGSQMQLFVNGVLTASTPFSGPMHVTNVPLFIGGYNPAYTSGPDSLIGVVDELEIHGRALTTDEIGSIFRAGSAGKCRPLNSSPTANAGHDQSVECTGQSCGAATLDGSGSSDPQGDALTYTWTWNGGTASGVNPMVTLPLGPTVVTLTVNDGKPGGTATDTVTITIEDTTPPTTTASLSGTPGQNGWYVSDVSVTLNATDSCTGVKEIHYIINTVESVVNGGRASFTLTNDGTYTITYWAVDNNGLAGVHGNTGVNRDATPPVTIPVVPAPPVDGNGYYWSCVPVTLTTVAGLSGVAEIVYSVDKGTTWIPYTGEFTVCGGGATTITYKAVTNAGNAEAPKTLVINIDTTPPTIIGSVSPSPNGYGWNTTDVLVTWTCSDTGSGIATCPSPITVTTEGLNQEISGTAYDKAGLPATAKITLNIDKTPPLITATITPAPNENGWNNSDVTVTFTCNDALSGIAFCPAPITVTTEGAEQVFSGTAVDKAGIMAIVVVTLNIDKTAPTITASVMQSPNASGWNNTDVTVTFTCSDSLSEIAFCPETVTATKEGVGQVVTGTAVDKAGNTATAQVTLNIDKTASVLSLSVSPGTLWPPNHRMVTVTPSVKVTDGNQGTTVRLVSVTSNEPDDGLGDGDTANDIVINADGTISLRAERSGTGAGRVYTITYQATDIAGNATTLSATVTVPHNM